MNDNLALGVIITAMAVVIPLFITCITPIIKLNKTIQKLNDSIDRLTESDNNKKLTLEKIDIKLDKHSQYLLVDKKRLDNLSKRVNKLDDEEGFIDTEPRG